MVTEASVQVTGMPALVETEGISQEVMAMDTEVTSEEATGMVIGMAMADSTGKTMKPKMEIIASKALR